MHERVAVRTAPGIFLSGGWWNMVEYGLLSVLLSFFSIKKQKAPQP